MFKVTSNCIAALNECINLGMPHDQQDKYIPHIGIGLYADAWLSDEVNLIALQGQMRRFVK
jgi:hypothetical protein